MQHLERAREAVAVDVGRRIEPVEDLDEEAAPTIGHDRRLAEAAIALRHARVAQHQRAQVVGRREAEVEARPLERGGRERGERKLIEVGVRPGRVERLAEASEGFVGHALTVGQSPVGVKGAAFRREGTAERAGVTPAWGRKNFATLVASEEPSSSESAASVTFASARGGAAPRRPRVASNGAVLGATTQRLRPDRYRTTKSLRGDSMRPIRISENFIPISEFKAQAADWLRRVGETGDPLFVTQNGKPAGVLLSPEAFDALTEQVRFIAAVNEGLADADANRTHSHASVRARLAARFGK